MPKEVHTLNDAILAAGSALSKAAPGRRRIIYVISDGKEYGSKAKFDDVRDICSRTRLRCGRRWWEIRRFRVWVYGPYVSAVDDAGQYPAAYASATGGQANAAYRTPTIETSFQKITEEVRTMYTVGYYSREPFLDGKFRSLEVRGSESWE